MRIWFPLAPDNADSRADRQEIGIGISVFHLPTAAANFSNYLRRYLGDPTSIETINTGVAPAAASENSDTEYLRRYLGDPV